MSTLPTGLMPIGETYIQTVQKTVSSNKWLKVVLIILAVYILIMGVIKFRKLSLYRMGTYTELVSGLHDAKTPIKIDGKQLPDSTVGHEFTISMWIYVNDWSYRYTQPKHVFHIGDEQAQSVVPGIWFYPKDNSAMIRIDTIARNDGQSMNPILQPANLDQRRPCDIVEIPFQKWVQLTVCLRTQAVDIFLDSKLIRTCQLDSLPKTSSGDIYVTQFGGFDGQIANVVHVNKAISPSTIASNYGSGY